MKKPAPFHYGARPVPKIEAVSKTVDSPLIYVSYRDGRPIIHHAEGRRMVLMSLPRVRWLEREAV